MTWGPQLCSKCVTEVHVVKIVQYLIKSYQASKTERQTAWSPWQNNKELLASFLTPLHIGVKHLMSHCLHYYSLKWKVILSNPRPHIFYGCAIAAGENIPFFLCIIWYTFPKYSVWHIWYLWRKLNRFLWVSTMCYLKTLKYTSSWWWRQWATLPYSFHHQIMEASCL